MRIQVNGQARTVDAAWRDESLLTVLRESLGLVGPKLGCGAGVCGACTVLLNDAPVRACVMPVAAVGDAVVTTIEGLSGPGRLHPVQAAWLEANVPQCGYCQAGQIMATVALLKTVPVPSEAQIDEALGGHLCRCGTQQRIRQAVRLAAGARP